MKKCIISFLLLVLCFLFFSAEVLAEKKTQNIEIYTARLGYSGYALGFGLADLINKKSNIQFGIGVHFPCTSKVIQSRKSLDLFAKTWIAMEPLLDFVLSK